MASAATNLNASSTEIPFAFFSAANEAAILLFELIQAKVSSPTLICRGKTIGYQLSLLSSSDDAEADGSTRRWTLGAGPSPALLEKGLKPTEPNLLLCIPGETPASAAVRSHIKDTHGVLEFNKASGVLRFRTFCNRPIIFERGDLHDNDLVLDLDEWGNGKSCVLRREHNYLRFGPYRFCLQFVVKTREDFKMFTKHLDNRIANNYHGLNPSCLFNLIPKPSPYHNVMGNIWLHNEIPTTHIITGVNIYTGHPVAIKKIRNSEIARTRQEVANRLRIALDTKDTQDGGILGVFDIWCSHQTSSPCLLDTNRQKTLDSCRDTFYSTPLAKYNFLDLPWGNTTYKERLSYAHQTLLGLAKLHEQGIVHGNIRPGSLLVLASPKKTSDPDAQAPTTTRAVLSLSTSQVWRKMLDTTCVCIAPEIWQQNTRTTADLDETKLDIWALAASWLHIFLQIPGHFKVATKEYHGVLQGQIKMKMTGTSSWKTLFALLDRMLAWEPHDRPSVAEILASDAWQPVREEKEKAEMERRKRKTEMQSSDVKRVRVISPEAEDCRVFEA
ncbi:kinase-like domain-containing protein [Trichoderma chlorosporum]